MLARLEAAIALDVVQMIITLILDDLMTDHLVGDHFQWRAVTETVCDTRPMIILLELRNLSALKFLAVTPVVTMMYEVTMMFEAQMNSLLQQKCICEAFRECYFYNEKTKNLFSMKILKFLFSEI